MTTSVRTPRGRTSPSHADCGCGCGGKGRCCGLECLVRPNFFCGQLLTDADLSATVQWARDRFGLVRYRDGWGVVCGLEVTCQASGGTSGCCPNGKGKVKVWIGPGYAVDCCGNDLVVCEPLCVDLSDVCRPADDPCADPCDDTVLRSTLDATGAPAAAGDDTLDLGEWTIPKREVVVVDLSLRYAELPEAGQRAMFRSGCSGESACEYTRMLERPEVVKTITELTNDPEYDESEEYRRRFEAARQEGIRRIKELLATEDPEEILRRLADYPVYSTCALADFIRARAGKSDTWRKQVGESLLVDWLQHELQCGCQVCRTDRGVPLARLLLWRKHGRVDCCRVLSILSRSPYRRPLRLDCRPVPTGKVDLAQAVGLSVREGRVLLSREPVVLDQPTPAATMDDVTSELLTDPGARVQPITMKDWMGVETIVGLRRG
jgi:hypothetical protein